jgi:hypothetical protein
MNWKWTGNGLLKNWKSAEMNWGFFVQNFWPLNKYYGKDLDLSIRDQDTVKLLKVGISEAVLYEW